MQQLRSHSTGPADRPAASKIDAVAWGLFFIWAGLAFLADVGWRTGIVGVGVIVLGAQAARWSVDLPVDLFGLGVGVAMVAWGGWGLLQPGVVGPEVPGSFWPVLLIAVGVMLVLRALLRRSSHGGKGSADVRREEA